MWRTESWWLEEKDNWGGKTASNALEHGGRAMGDNN